MIRRVALLSFVVSTIGACGAVYIPQSFEIPSGGYGYHRTDHVDVEVLPLTFVTAQEANTDGYRPRGLPKAFAETDPIVDISTRDRIAAAGLDGVDPALEFDPLPSPPTTYDPSKEILPPLMRRDDAMPTRVPATAAGEVDMRLDRYDSAFGDASVSAPAIRPVSPPREPEFNPPPAIDPQPYRIGAGDVMALVSKLQPLTTNGSADSSPVADATTRLLVQGNGEIYVPQIGQINVGGLTLEEARRVIFERLVDNKLDFDFGIEIAEFGSQKVAVSGVEGAQLLPITVRPLTLGEAIAAAGGLGADPQNIVVRVLRDGSIYEVPAINVLESSNLSQRVLVDGDAVYISPLYDVERALAYFEQQLKLQDIRRQERDDIRAQIDFEIAKETYRLESERLRQEATLARFEAEKGAEEARIANVEARQDYLDRLRTLQEANRTAVREAERERRATLLSNAQERAREREERRGLLELELQEERARLEQLAEQREQARALFQERAALGAIQRDYVTIAGEIQKQVTFPLPFEGVVTLNRVLYETTGGPNVITGDSSEIYVIRRATPGAANERLIAYHLDASNAANLSVATLFEMRPNDVVFVNPQPITNWNRVITQLLPSTGFIGSVSSSVSGLGSN